MPEEDEEGRDEEDKGEKRDMRMYLKRASEEQAQGEAKEGS